MKSLIVSFLCAGGAFAACGVQFFADAVNGNDDWDGTTAVHEEGTLNGPKRTLQAAVDLADGVTWTTITAAPGIYDQGEALVEGNATPNRLVIGKPYVTIEASGKKEETHIVGRKDASGAFGIGPNSVRCVYVMNLIDTARPDLKNQLKAVVLKGFTIRDGSSQLYGGGVFCEHKDNGGLTLVDCVVSNCAAARGGAAFRVAAFRTLFADNHSTAGESATAAAGGVVDFGTYESCIFANNHGSPVLNYPLQVVGCTFYGNECRVIGSFYDKGNKLYNCLSICNAGGNGGSATYQNVPDAVNCVVAGNSYLTPDSTGSKSGAEVREEQCVSTAFGDVRLFSDSDAIGAGDAQWQTKMTLPDGFAHTDFFGTSLPAGGAIDAGAVQSASEVRPTARLVRFKDAAFAFDGTLAGPETYFYESGSWPKVYDLGVRFGSGQRCFAVYIEGETYSSHPYYRPLDHSGRVSLVLPPAAAGSSADVVIRARAATGVAYANPDETKASDAYDGLAPVYDGTHGPKLTLQAAVNVITESYGLVLAASGVYDRGGATQPAGEGGQTNRIYVSKTVGIVAQDGPGTATLKGAPDPATGTVGPGAIRAAWLNGASYLQGFKITSSYGNGENKYYSKGSVYMGSGNDANVVDCEVFGNYAWTAPTINYGRAERTVFHDNHALCATSGYAVDNALLVNCVLYGNEIPDDGGSSLLRNDTRLCGCTVDAGGSLLIEGDSALGWPKVRGCIILNVSTTFTAPGTDNLINRDCHLADPANHDYRIGAASPAIGRVTAAHYAAENYSRYVTGDIDGRPLAMTADGAVTAGAYHTALPYAVFLPTDGSIAVSGASVGTNVLAGPLVATVEVLKKDRPYGGITVNGEVVGTGWTQEVSLSGEVQAEVRAVYGTNWYVSVATGSDANGGGSAACPKASLKGAAQYAASGDVIHVARGVYRAETMLHDAICEYTPSAITIPSRLWIKEGVSVVSDEGADVTVIEGAPATAGDEHGLGTDAVRGVVMDRSTKLVGFTVTGGRTGSVYGSIDDCTGGGIIAKSYASSLVENCIISNNAALRSGGAHKCRLVNCRIVGNTGLCAGSAGRECVYVQCLIDGNVGTNAVQYYTSMDFCTVGAGNVLPNGEPVEALMGNQQDGSPVRNTLLLCPLIHSFVTNLQHCAFIRGAVRNVAATVDCISTNAEALAVDAACRPVVGSNAAIDAAVAAVDELPPSDLSGFQRVMNGLPDIGALEADWRPVYARKLSGRRFLCLAADPCARLSDDGVALNGGSIALRTAQDVPEEGATLRVVGRGNLSMTLDGESVDPAAATHLDAGAHDIVFSGEAEVLECRIPDGLMLLIR